ncbi:Ydr124wp-like protein [Metarhizium guizhouense ARSEF 977]|uniref:Ydr124wp-like protein n=1 Tax=Metarhizium guizhouense (strain ARSEF 977) TaxID=1276136 RepID=A0A0B4GM44_METGA|nr:Ydr124wp-like protein [Metarhizium guizhouense ARSEF 977]
MDDGRLLTSHSHGQAISHDILSRFFDAVEFCRVVNELGQETDPLPGAINRASFYTPDCTGSARGLESERTPLSSQSPPTPSTVAPLTVASESIYSLPQNRITVNDAPAMWKAYKYLFGCCQQTMCKMIAKIWIQTLSPKKQATHPYQGGQATAPAWWPTNCLTKKRINLLAHILRLLVEPSAKQHIAIRSLGLDVKRLEDITSSKLRDFLEKHDTNSRKRQRLAQLFELAQQEARFRNGDIGRHKPIQPIYGQ